METIRKNIETWLESQDKSWRELPLEKQRRYTLYLFLGYLLLTGGVVFQICYDMAESNNKISVQHIENPVLKDKESPASLQDTLSRISKNKIYEGK